MCRKRVRASSVSTTTSVHPEGARYASSIVYLPGLWVGAEAIRGAASYLGHRGWAGAIVDQRSVAGGIAERVGALEKLVASLPTPPVVVATDGAAVVAVAAAARMPIRALVLVSPLLPGAAGAHALVWSRRLVWSLLRRRAVPPVGGAAGAAFFADVPVAAMRDAGPEDARILAALSRRSRLARRSPMPSALVLRGALDPIVASEDARAFTRAVDGELEEIPARGHRLLCGPGWQDSVQRVHRWLVRRLGEANLELYAEAMADREDADE